MLLYRTFYDKAAYKEFLQDHQLLVDRDNQLLLPGLYAYYEKVGQLCEDNTVWAMGSLDDHFAGQFNMQIQYEPRAFHSMLHLLEEQPLFVPQIFRLFAYLSMLKESKVEAEIDNLSALLEAFPFEFLQLSDWKAALKAFLREPGALAVWCNDLLSSMGNPEQGGLIQLLTVT